MGVNGTGKNIAASNLSTPTVGDSKKMTGNQSMVNNSVDALPKGLLNSKKDFPKDDNSKNPDPGPAEISDYVKKDDGPSPKSGGAAIKIKRPNNWKRTSAISPDVHVELDQQQRVVKRNEL